jgi:hypothetical protein
MCVSLGKKPSKFIDSHFFGEGLSLSARQRIAASLGAADGGPFLRGGCKRPGRKRHPDEQCLATRVSRRGVGGPGSKAQGACF